MVPMRPPARASWITFLDVALIVSASSALVILLGGRTRVDVGTVRLTIKAATNALLFTAGFAALRLWLGWGVRPLPLVPAPDPVTIEAERARFARPMPRAPGLAAYAAATVLASILWLMPHFLHPRQVPDPGDPILSAWRLARFAHQLTTDPRHLFDGNIFYPASGTLTFSDATVLQALVATPFLVAGCDPLLVSNALFLAAFPLNALAFFYLGWRLTSDPRIAFLTGVLGALMPFHTEHYSHLELQYTWFIPLAIVALLEVLASPSLWRGARLGLFVAGQWLASMYLGLMLLTVLVPFGVVVAAGWRVRSWRIALASLAVALAIVVAAFAALGIPYLQSQAARGERSLALAGYFSAQPAEYGHPHTRLLTYQRMSTRGHRTERQLFPGFTTLAAAAIGAAPPLGAVGAASLAAGALAFDWSLGPSGLTYDDLYRWLLPYRGLRVPARFAALVSTALILLAAFGWRRLLGAAARARLGTLAFVAFAVLTLVDLRIQLNLRDYWPTAPPVYRSVSASMVLAEFPWDNAPDYMYFSTRHWARLLNGYSGSFPQGFVDLQNEVKDFPSPHSLGALRAAGATHVTYNCRFASGPARCNNTLALLDSSASLERVDRATWENAEVRLYRFR